MKSTAYRLNVSRGGVTDEGALWESLKHKVIAGAGLDVFEKEPLPKDSPLLTLDNVILTPHSAAISPMGSNILYDVQRASANLFSVVNGGPLVPGEVVTG